MSDYLATADVWTVLDLIAVEFRTDPTSVQCFDGRLVQRAIALAAQHPPDRPSLELFAWVGEDEFGSGRVGLKQGLTRAGLHPLVVVDYDRHKIDRMRATLQQQADRYGRTIRFARFTFVEDVLTLTPRARPQG
jgi:hypothetical protein